MNLNATLVLQSIAMMIFVWFLVDLRNVTRGGKEES